MIDHQEEWQVFGVNADPIKNESILPKDSRSNPNVIVGAVHVWIWRQTETTIEILLQHRVATKPTWPDFWDISFAGHIDAGESKFDAAIREGQEEIGCDIEPSELEYIFSYRNFENGLKWVYLYQEKSPQAYKFNDGEVEELKWVSLESLANMTEQPEINKLVPHPSEYYSLLLSALNESYRSLNPS